MTAPDLEEGPWIVAHAPVAGSPTIGALCDVTGVFYRWDLAVEWAARYFPDDRSSVVLQLTLLKPEFEDEAAALGEVAPCCWLLVGREDTRHELAGCVGPFVNRGIAYADLALHLDRYRGHLTALANWGVLSDRRLTGEPGLPPA